jgi:hypothetical protein
VIIVYNPSQQAICQFILLADASDDIPNLSNQHSYADYHLSRRDWEHLENIKDALRVRFPILLLPRLTLPRNLQTSSKPSRRSASLQSGESYQVSSFSSNGGKQWLQNSTIKDSQKHSTRVSRAFGNGMAMLMANHLRTLFVLVCPHTFLEHHSNFLILVLDPNVKDLYFRGWWSTAQYAAGMKQLEDVVSEHTLPSFTRNGYSPTPSLTGIILHPTTR